MLIGLILLLSPSELYKEATDAYNKGNFEIARKKIEQFLIKYPEDKLAPEALYLAARLRKEEKEALNYYEKIIANYPGSKAAPLALYDLAQYWYAKSEYAEAIKAYKKIVFTYPKSSSARDSQKWIDTIRGFYFIQLGYFTKPENAYRLSEELKKFNPLVLEQNRHYRVWIGIFSSHKEAKEFMLNAGLKGFVTKIK